MRGEKGRRGRNRCLGSSTRARGCPAPNCIPPVGFQGCHCTETDLTPWGMLCNAEALAGPLLLPASRLPWPQRVLTLITLCVFPRTVQGGGQAQGRVTSDSLEVPHGHTDSPELPSRQVGEPPQSRGAALRSFLQKLPALTCSGLGTTKGMRASMGTTHGDMVVPKLFPRNGPRGTYSHF